MSRALTSDSLRLLAMRNESQDNDKAYSALNQAAFAANQAAMEIDKAVEAMAEQPKEEARL